MHREIGKLAASPVEEADYPLSAPGPVADLLLTDKGPPFQGIACRTAAEAAAANRRYGRVVEPLIVVEREHPVVGCQVDRPPLLRSVAVEGMVFDAAGGGRGQLPDRVDLVGGEHEHLVAPGEAGERGGQVAAAASGDHHG